MKKILLAFMITLGMATGLMSTSSFAQVNPTTPWVLIGQEFIYRFNQIYLECTYERYSYGGGQTWYERHSWYYTDRVTCPVTQ